MKLGKQCRNSERSICLKEPPLRKILCGLGQLTLPLWALSVHLEVILHRL